ncbi:plasmodesmata-located protein 7-like [Tasmannia lanceolata]|uniref:plasmodesmata-located protein 7-like n=1 Tax=Tasmannia lanceolata TaxID=3420 RepID=UPI0040646795
MSSESQKTHLPSLLSFLLLLLSSLPKLASPSSSDSFVYGGCSQQKFIPNSPFQSNLNSLLTSLVNSAYFSSYNNFTITASDPASPVSGLFQCGGDLDQSDCAECVQHSVSQLGILCLYSAGGTLQFQGCFVKYDNTIFLGVEDKTLVLKECGISAGYGTDLLSRRDEVLTGLGCGSGLFRVGVSGYVQGMAQCVGDLDSGQCSDCLLEAIERLRGGCGAAVSGDIYLGKCYVRFSAGGVSTKAHNQQEKNSEAGKIVAIIIGLLAGVGLIIVFLSFLRKVFEGTKGEEVSSSEKEDDQTNTKGLQKKEGKVFEGTKGEEVSSSKSPSKKEDDQTNTKDLQKKKRKGV